jgi:hypothetical protein
MICVIFQKEKEPNKTPIFLPIPLKGEEQYHFNKRVAHPPIYVSPFSHPPKE